VLAGISLSSRLFYQLNESAGQFVDPMFLTKAKSLLLQQFSTYADGATTGNYNKGHDSLIASSEDPFL
jgi:hypothetical protein